MNFVVANKLFLPLLAAAEESGALRAVEFDFPESGWEWFLYGGGFALAFLLVVWLYIRDTSAFSGIWRVCLTTLRLGVLAALVIIALNPQERTQKRAYRPSRVAMLVDSSLSMRFPEHMPAEDTPEEGSQDARSRAESVREFLSKSSLFQELQAQHEVSVYSFDSRLTGPHHVFPSRIRQTQAQESAPPSPKNSENDKTNSPDWEEIVRPQGLETRLGESLLDLIRQVNGRTLSGIVVLSDGGSNAGVEVSTAQEAAVSNNVRLITVGVGSTEPPVNLQIANLQAPTDVQKGGDVYEISAMVQGQGLAGRTAKVELLMRREGEQAEPTLLDSREVTLLEDGVPVEVKFSRTPSEAATLEYLVRAQPTSGIRELSDEDNRRTKTIRVVDRKTRVLLVSGGPSRDYRFVRNMLYRHSNIEVDVLLQSVRPDRVGAVSQEANEILLEFPDTREELFDKKQGYDVVVAFDPDWTRIPAESLKILNEWVYSQGGGLILVAGDIYTPELSDSSEEMSPLLELYPVVLSPHILDYQLDYDAEQPWPIEFTREGKEAGFLQLEDVPTASESLWNQFSGFYRVYPTNGSKAGAVVYAHFADPRTQTEYGQPILLASQFYGSGRSLYMGSAEFWRLRALDESYFDRFWTKAIREVGQGRVNRGTSRGMLLLEREEYYLGQTVQVRARLLNPQFQPLKAESISLEVYDPNGKPLVPARRLSQAPNRPGQYVGDFRANLPGKYHLELSIPESNDQLTKSVDVKLPNLESDNPRQDARLLTDLTRDTGGTYLRLDKAESRLASLLPNRGEEFLVDERLRTLWDRQWLMYLLVGLLCLEWLTRKYLKLA